MNFFLQVRNLILLFDILFFKEGWNDVFNFRFLVFESDVRKVPVFDDEMKMVSNSNLVGDFDTLIVNITHHGD